MRNKKVIAMLFAGLLLVGNTFPVLADGTTTGNSTVNDDTGTELFTTTDSPWSDQEGTAVIYNQDAYDADVTVIIPKNIALSSSKEATYTVTVKGYVEDGMEVTVAPHDDIDTETGVNFYMSATNITKDDVVATVVQNDTVWGYADITETGTSKTGNITADDLSRGDWSGNLTFDISLSSDGAVQTN